jgi:hypothetical protein
MVLVAAAVGVSAFFYWSLVGVVFPVSWPLLALCVAGWARRVAVGELAADSGVRNLAVA